jgi:hypothetical protein
MDRDHDTAAAESRLECKHPPCKCMCMPEEEYCSIACANPKDQMECVCTHAACRDEEAVV